MTTLTLAKLAEIEAAAAKATPGPWSWDGKVWNYDSEQEAPWLVADRKSIVTGEVHCSEANATFIAACDPATVTALCRVARCAFAVVEQDDRGSYVRRNDAASNAMEALRAAGLLE